jgi:hypothetical protein
LNVLHVEYFRTRLCQLPSSPPDVSGDLPRALLGYDEASASGRADYVDFLQTRRGFAHSYVDAVVERIRFQSGASAAWRGGVLKGSFKEGPCNQLKSILKEGTFFPQPLLLPTA